MTFKIPTLIIGTTNYPEVFMENITNRPQRFDVKIEVGYPNAEARASLLEFFMKEKGVTPEQKAAIQKKECSQFSIAHIYEAAIRSYIFEMPLQEAIEEIRKEIELVKKAFDKSKKSVGFGSGGWD
jgi:SpoVK/Ycf46/Vps4 family AAA+-type ATPase